MNLQDLAEIARLRARLAAYEAVLDEIATVTTDNAARTLAWGVLGDYTEDRKHERGTV